MKLAEVATDVATHLNELSERYEVPERMRQAGHAARRGAITASEAARRSADAAYRMALEHPRGALAGIVLAGMIVGGALWYMFGRGGKPVQRRRKPGVRMRAGTERRRSARAR